MLPIKALPPPPPLSRATTSGTTQNHGAVRHHNQSSALEATGGRRSRPMGGRRRADLTSGRRALTWSTGSRSPAQRHTGPRLRPSSKRPETGGGWVSLDTSPGRGGGQGAEVTTPESSPPRGGPELYGHTYIYIYIYISGETDQCVHGSVQITVLGLGFGYGSD